MLAEDCEDYVEVICRIGSLEIFLVKILNSK